MSESTGQQDRWETQQEKREDKRDKWEDVITTSVMGLQQTAADLKVAVQASKDNVERVFEGLSKCQESREFYRSHTDAMLSEQREINKEQKEISKSFNEQINGREGLFVMVGKLGQSVLDLKDTVDNYIKSTFWALIGAGVLGLIGKYFKWW